jgi:hypothetical protein
MHSRQTLLGLLAVAVIGVASVPFLLRAEDPQLAQRRQSIAAMTQADRQRLQRNFERFTAMNDAQRAQLSDFAAALETDRTTQRGRLNETLRVYEQWLQTLTPHQRDALRKETAPLQRIALMRQLVDEQRDDRIEIRMGDRGAFLGPIPAIGRKDLEAMLEIISGKLGLYLNRSQELEGYEGMRRYLKMFELLSRQGRSVHQLLGEDNVQLLLQAISDEQTREQLQSIPDIERPQAEAPLRRTKLALAMFQAIETELDRELRSRRVSPENLTRYFEKLDQDQQDELLTLTPAQFRQQLLSRYVETEWSQNRINMGLVRQFFRPQRPPGERPPGDNPPAERRPGDGPPRGGGLGDGPLPDRPRGERLPSDRGGSVPRGPR